MMPCSRDIVFFTVTVSLLPSVFLCNEGSSAFLNNIMLLGFVLSLKSLKKISFKRFKLSADFDFLKRFHQLYIEGCSFSSVLISSKILYPM